jgi:hypothetical protein
VHGLCVHGVCVHGLCVHGVCVHGVCSAVRFLLEGDIGAHRILLLFAVECRLHLERGVACRLVTYRGGVVVQALQE